MPLVAMFFHELASHLHKMATEEESYELGSAEPEGLSLKDEQIIERLFSEAELDRTKAYELKRELDRLDVFPEYKDRFLDLFKKPGPD